MRVDRLGLGHPIRVLFVGALSAQKGLLDLAEAVRSLPPERFVLRLVGPRVPETAALLRRMPKAVQVLGKRPETELPDHYSWADVFVFPSVQDGFAVVLAQASAAGLPIIASTNCGASEFVEEGRTGWIVSVRSPHLIADRLRWYDAHRAEAIEMVNDCARAGRSRSWNDVGRDFLAMCGSGPRSGPPSTPSGASAE
jgi:glycosyltransferase involved in cell wall biosynthesis